MTEPEGIWVTESEVVASLDLAGAIGALRAGLRLEATGSAGNLEKTHTIWDGGNTLHALGATLQGDGIVGTKTWAHTHGGATPLLLLWDSDDGHLVAVIEAFALGQLRTSGMSGVATDLMASPGACRFALIGAGAQALAQAAAVAAVRPIEEITVFSRDVAKATALADRLGHELSVAVRAVDVVSEAVRGAEIVTTVTRAREPILGLRMLDDDVHINAIGAITPERRELFPDVIERADIITCDTVAGARRLATDLRAVLGDDDRRWADVRSLAQVLVDVPSREPGSLTLYKGMGTGLADVALGIAVVSAVRAHGRARAIPQPNRTSPRLFPSAK